MKLRLLLGCFGQTWGSKISRSRSCSLPTFSRDYSAMVKSVYPELVLCMYGTLKCHLVYILDFTASILGYHNCKLYVFCVLESLGACK